MCRRRSRLGTALVAFSPVGRSLLTDRPCSPEKADTLPFLKVNPRFQEPNLSANIEAGKPFRQLAADMGTSAAALSIAWLIHRADHAVPIGHPVRRTIFANIVPGAALDLDDAAHGRHRRGACRLAGHMVTAIPHAQWVGPEKILLETMTDHRGHDAQH